MRTACGQSAVEFILVVPFLIFLIVAVVEVTVICVNGEVTLYRWFSRARAAKVFVPGRELGTAGIAALPQGLSNEVLTTGDNPSPYCRRGEEYKGPWECR